FAYHHWYKRMERDFGFVQGTIANFTERFLDAFDDCFPDVIKWPMGNRVAEVAAGFANRLARGPIYIDNVIGAIDGSLFKIATPDEYGPRYIDRKGDHSLNVLLICDYEEKFAYIYAGEPGSVHDTRVLRHSPLWQKIEAGESVRYFPDGTHLLGDS